MKFSDFISVESIRADLTADASLDKSVYDILGVQHAINAFKSYGSTAPAEVRKQIDSWKQRVSTTATVPSPPGSGLG